MRKEYLRAGEVSGWLIITLVLLAGCGGNNANSGVNISRVDSNYKPMPLPPLNNAKAPSTAARKPSHPWAPTYKEVSGRWQGIMIHHTATDNGNAKHFDRCHKDRGWDGLGYHFVIDNGKGGKNGQVEVGWRWQQQREGAHCRVRADDDNYWNEHYIGIVLVGNFEKYAPTKAQYESLAKLVGFLQDRYHIPQSKIKGHRDADKTKCPGRLFNFRTLFAQLQRQRNQHLAK